MRFSVYSNVEFPECNTKIYVADSYRALVTKLFPEFEFNEDMDDEQFEYALNVWKMEGNGVIFDALYIDDNPFTDTEMSEILELARLCLADSSVADSFADAMDLSDEYLTGLRDKIEKVTNGVEICL